MHLSRSGSNYSTLLVSSYGACAIRPNLRRRKASKQSEKARCQENRGERQCWHSNEADGDCPTYICMKRADGRFAIRAETMSTKYVTAAVRRRRQQQSAPSPRLHPSAVRPRRWIARAPTAGQRRKPVMKIYDVATDAAAAAKLVFSPREQRACVRAPATRQPPQHIRSSPGHLPPPRTRSYP